MGCTNTPKMQDSILLSISPNLLKTHTWIQQLNLFYPTIKLHKQSLHNLSLTAPSLSINKKYIE